MNTWPVLLLLLGVAVVLAWGARRIHVPIPIVLVLGGLALAFVPGLPIVEVEDFLQAQRQMRDIFLHVIALARRLGFAPAAAQVNR